MLSDREGWALGYNTLLRWHAGAWQPVTPPVSEGLADVDMLTDSDGWIVGSAPAEGDPALIQRQDGTQWAQVTQEYKGDLSAVDALSTGDVWAVGHRNSQSQILHWDGQAWNEVPRPVTANSMSVALDGSGNAQAAGYQGPLRSHPNGQPYRLSIPLVRR
jgi:hypothetical protein